MPQAPVEFELPREAVAEAIVNAVAHRDYTSNASVQVMLFADRLEVWNPGELPPGLTLDQLCVPHASIPHNPLIAEPLFLAHYAEKAGSGILDMIARCRETGLPAPQFRQGGGQFIQTLWRPKPAAPIQAQVSQESQPSRRPSRQPSRQTQSGDPVVRLLEALRKGEQSSGELRWTLGLKHRPTFRENLPPPGLGSGFHRSHPS